jgi:hypothetical protein
LGMIVSYDRGDHSGLHREMIASLTRRRGFSDVSDPGDESPGYLHALLRDALEFSAPERGHCD